MWCVRSPKLYILWNGAKLDGFQPTRGLHQGDPLSPYLFVICNEKLALSIQQKVNYGIWHPVYISRGGLGLSHLYFADDVLLFCHANSGQVQLVMDTLQDFCMAYGLKASCDKSRAMCSPKLTRIRKENFRSISYICFVSDLGIYLDFPLVQERVNKNAYNNVVEKIQRRMVAWKPKLLNKARKVCLAKSVTSAIHIYVDPLLAC